ncbi:DUF2076 domain-containing protein [Rhizobium sp. YIM 134829]|uniref:DUF2076 domain-containing protein n=1 Tax=Rhizobium sp. YIM 134829 TaxID=3390453 RepID=UPI003979A69A
MSPEERQLLTALFDRVKTATATPRDREAEALIADAIRQEPAAPYYLAQAVIVQEKGLEAAAARIEELEQRLRRAESSTAAPQHEEGGGFLSSIFGSRDTPRRADPPQPSGYGQRPVAQQAPTGPWGRAPDPGYGAPPAGYAGGGYGGAPVGYGAPQGGGLFSGGNRSGGGFLSGAMTTAAGVAGGMLLANSLSGLFANHMTGLGLGNAVPADFPVEETVINNYYGDDAITQANDDTGALNDGGFQQASDDGGQADPGYDQDAGFDQDFGGDDSGSMDV